jgi:hypothetical protein
LMIDDRRMLILRQAPGLPGDGFAHKVSSHVGPEGLPKI